MGIDNNSDNIIKSYKFIGQSLYERRRLLENKISLEFESVHCNDIGLYVIGKYPRLKFGALSNSEDLNWKWHTVATIKLTLLNLINKGVIEVVQVQDSKSYFFNLFKRYDIDYYFKVTDLQQDKDWFSVLM